MGAPTERFGPTERFRRLQWAWSARPGMAGRPVGMRSTMAFERAPPSHAAGQCRMLTARAITRSEVHRAETLWMLIRSFARVDSGIVSVGLNAVEFVTDT